MTAITLTRRDQAKNRYRFHRLDVQRDLFGSWSFIREWGRWAEADRCAKSPSLPPARRSPRLNVSTAPRKTRLPKRHHFIPRLHLQHFGGPEPKGQVWTYDAQTRQVRSAVPEQTAVESHFYSVERDDGTMNTGIETKLAENRARSCVLLRGTVAGEHLR